MQPAPRALSVVLFEGFELLDVFGPLEMFAMAPELLTVTLLGPGAASVASAQGPRVEVDFPYADAPLTDIVLVPGGIGTRVLAADLDFLSWLRSYCAPATYVTSVCTGSGVLAAAGLLDGFRATSNKAAFAWPKSQGTEVTWLPMARWVEDGSRWTSSGVAAGMDMALALIAHLGGVDRARGVADEVEYPWQEDSTWDPYAEKYGLTAN